MFYIKFTVLTIILSVLILITHTKNTIYADSHGFNKNAKNTITKRQKAMIILIDGKEFNIKSDNNKTALDIILKLPLNLKLQHYAGHEYFTKLNFTPVVDKDTTSFLKAGHLYYWNDGNTLCINYKDYDVSPYKLVHLGEIKEPEISELLKKSQKEITVEIKLK